MSETTVDTSKRTWLIASSCAGAVGGVAVAIPFVSNFSPSERAKAAGAAVEVDIASIKPGEKLTVEWRGKPVWIVRRTPEQLEALKKVESQLADPSPSAIPLNLPLNTPEIRPDPSSQSFLLAWVFAPIWDARPAINFKWGRSHRCQTIGKVDFFAPAMVRLLTWLDAFTKTSLPQTTWKSPPICTFQTLVC